MHPLVLGYTDNKLLDDYFGSYFSDLRTFLSGKTDDTSLIPEFLLIPDISTTIEHIRRNPSDTERGLGFLSEEWEIFSAGGKDGMLSFQGDTIPWTDIRLTDSDANPDNHVDIHPDHPKEGVGIGWGDVGKDEWLRLYSESLSILRRASPWFSVELDRMVRKIIPMGTSVSKHNSASYSSCIGHLYMSYPTGMDRPELAVLEAIIHESNHNKLNLIMKSDPLVLNAREEIYYSPYRPDARHIHGIYLGLHAMVAVFHVFFSAYRDGIILLDDQWMEKSLSYVMKNGLSIRILQKYGSYSPLGRNILDGMVAVHRDTWAMIRGLGIGTDIRKRSEDTVRKHFSSVVHAHPYLRS